MGKTSPEAQALATAEARLRVTLPNAYRTAILEKRSLQKAERWELFRPDELQRPADHDADDIDGIVVGCDVGGNLLLFLFDGDQPTVLGETLFAWDHETEEVAREAGSFLEIIVPAAIDAAATALIGADQKSDDEYGEDDPEDESAPTRSCEDCTTDIPLDAIECPQCGHVRGEKTEDRLDPHTEKWAALLIDALVAEGALELVNRRSRDTLVRVTAPFFDLGGFAALPDVQQLLKRWEEHPDVGEIFLDEAELEQRIASLKLPGFTLDAKP